MTIFEDRNLKEIIQVKLDKTERFERRMSVEEKDEHTHTWLGVQKYRKRQRETETCEKKTVNCKLRRGASEEAKIFSILISPFIPCTARKSISVFKPHGMCTSFHSCNNLLQLGSCIHLKFTQL